MENKESKESPEDKSLIKRQALACIIGHTLGDVLGAYCERKTEIDIDEVMSMPGGGVYQIQCGQVTDDTELSITLSRALLKCGKKFNLTIIAQGYYEWLKSECFDIGTCTHTLLQEAPNVDAMKRKAKEYDLQCAKDFNSEGNLANGSLMRCIPLAIYGHQLDHDTLYLLCKSEAELTHHNTINFLVVTSYAIMILYLIQSQPSDSTRNEKAYDTMEKLLQQIKLCGDTEQVCLHNFIFFFLVWTTKIW